jgi:hypothetical protein
MSIDEADANPRLFTILRIMADRAGLNGIRYFLTDCRGFSAFCG